MRLTILNQFYVPDLSPTAHLAASLAEHRTEKGDTVTVVAGRGSYVSGTASDHRRTDNPRVRRVWTPALGKASLVRRLADYVSFITTAAFAMALLPRQDVVVCLTTPPYVALAAALYKILNPKSRLLLWNMDCYPDAAEQAGLIAQGGWVSCILRSVNRWLYRRFDAIVALDHAMAARLRPDAGRASVHVVPNWEQERDFPPNASPWAGAASLGLAGKFVVLYAGNAGLGHRFETVVEVARRLIQEPVVFLFIGGGSQFEWIRSKAIKLPNVLLHPYVPKEEMAHVLAMAGCSLITMRDEMAGIVSPSKLHGSLAMGVPILYIGPAAGNVHEAIERFRCGMSIRNGDPEPVIEFVRHLMRGDPEMRQRAHGAFREAFCDRSGLAAFDELLDADRGHGKRSNPTKLRICAALIEDARPPGPAAR